MLSHESDGCTLFPDGSYVSCCDMHDAAYGALYNRRKADKDLKKCVDACGRPVLAWVIWLGVRLGGWPFWWRCWLERKLNVR